MTGACTTPTTVTCYAITTDHDYGVPQHVAGRVHTHPGGTLPWHTSTDVAGVTTVVAGEPSIRSVNSPELAGHRDTDGDFPRRRLVTRLEPRRLSRGPQLATLDEGYSSPTSGDWMSSLRYQRATDPSSTHTRPARSATVDDASATCTNW